MVKRESTKRGFLSATDVLYIPLYGVESAILNVVRADSYADTPNAFIQSTIRRRYDYSQMVTKFDTPQLFYAFDNPPDSGTTAHEKNSGTSVTVTGGNLIAGTPFGPYSLDANYVGLGVVTSGAQSAWWSADDNAGTGWTLDFWVNRSNNTAIASIYIETNVGITNFLQLFMNTNGTLQINSAGGTASAYTSPVGNPIGLNAWHHVGLVYNGANIQLYIDGQTAGAATAYTHGTGHVGGTNRINFSQNSQLSVFGMAVYNQQFTQNDMDRHYHLQAQVLNGPYASVAFGGPWTAMAVLFTNAAAPAVSTGFQSNIITCPLSNIYFLSFTGTPPHQFLYELKRIFSS